MPDLGCHRFLILWQLPMHLDRTFLAFGGAAEHAASQRLTKYADIMHSYNFVSIAVETLGSWSSDALTCVKQLFKRIS